MWLTLYLHSGQLAYLRWSNCPYRCLVCCCFSLYTCIHYTCTTLRLGGTDKSLPPFELQEGKEKAALLSFRQISVYLFKALITWCIMSCQSTCCAPASDRCWYQPRIGNWNIGVTCSSVCSLLGLQNTHKTAKLKYPPHTWMEAKVPTPYMDGLWNHGPLGLDMYHTQLQEMLAHS